MALRKFTAVRNIAIFAGVLAACLLAPAVVRHYTGKAFEEFRAPLDAIPSQLNDLEKFWDLRMNYSKSELIEVGRDLARLNAGYAIKLTENEALKSRVESLEKILSLPGEEKFKMEVARVARRDINAWWQHLIIRKGAAHGIREGYAVIYGGGVVGRVVKANTYTSVVELVSSRGFRMAAHFLGEDRPVIYQGAGSLSFQDARGEVRDVPADLKASTLKPLQLVTSPLAGSFPDGILRGDVIDLTLEPDGIFRSGTVRLPRTLGGVREVAVLIPVSDLMEE